ncbi:DUF2914 domain-containing protein [Nannocystaceae bacterium ST9]
MNAVGRSLVLVMFAGALACDAPPPAKKGSEKAPAAKQGTPAKVEPAKVEPAKVEPAKVEAPPVETPPVEAPPVEAPPVETPPVEAPPAGTLDVRSDAVIPAGTSAANANAFKKLAVAKGDGAPVGGIGINGVHLDALDLGAGWEKSRCADPTTTFVIGTNDRVNVCMRIIHERGTTEELSVEWIKNGKSSRRSKVAVSDMHAYLTRAYLPIHEGYAGDWKAVITSSDKTVLGEVAFKVE